MAAMIDDRSTCRPIPLFRFVLESVPFAGDAAQQEGGANRHGQGCYGADDKAEVDALE
jgi:hypothetical protein